MENSLYHLPHKRGDILVQDVMGRHWKANSSAVTPTQSPDILTWIRQEVAQGISEAMEASNRSVKRPRQRLVSSESSVSEYQGSAEEFQVLDQIYSSENEEEVLSEYLLPRRWINSS
ncbi:Hypothetical predicted protein [Pelobates cultripes]|uniref:Uncharacterized protein n=1 Tax=Pelobates cultripes TaxID=61616 RepID=A0AAD1WV95_PELCU|nr:Hypothetical predicted protein [Pelobates cultripes]